MGWPSHRPRCLAPVGYRSSAGDPDPVCWRVKGHAEREEAAGRPVRHLSRRAYLNELARSQKARGNYR
jgi:hypothetical protein